MTEKRASFVGLHEGARQAIDRAAEALASEQTLIYHQQPGPGASPFDQLPASGQLSEDQISNIEPLYQDQQGQTIALFVQEEGKALRVLPPKGIAILSRIESELRKSPAIDREISRAFLEETVQDWLRLTSSARGSFSQHLEKRAAEHVEERVFWIPTPNLHVETNVRLGPVEMRLMSEEVFGRWRESALHGLTDATHRERITAHFQRMYEEFGERAAIVVQTRGDKVRAEEWSLKFAREATALLSLFHPAQRSVDNLFFGQPAGETPERTNVAIEETRAGQGLPHNFMARPWPDFVTVDFAALGSRGAEVFRVWAALTSGEPLTEYARRLLDALFLYSRNAGQRDPTDRLIYLFAALERMLSRQDEPVAQPLADRIAFLTAPDVRNRLLCVKLVKKMYAERSNFVHRGEALRLDRDFVAFLSVAHLAFMKMIDRLQKYSLAAELFQELDEMKYSGKEANGPCEEVSGGHKGQDYQ